MPIRVFISHASADEQLATALVHALLGCVRPAADEIRCTSAPGHKLPIGADTATTLRDELATTSVVIGLLTPTSTDSSWVLFELGASWGARKTLMAFLAGDVTFAELPGPLAGQHAIRPSDSVGLAQAVEEIASRTGTKDRPLWRGLAPVRFAAMAR